MNDAEFCTDAHRQSFAEEQQLAMRRLAESSSAMQRTQRMVAAAAIMDHGGPTMNVFGGPLPLDPPSYRGVQIEIPAEPMPIPATVHFIERAHVYTATALFAHYYVAPQVQAAAGTFPRLSIVEHTPHLRLVIPRALSSTPVCPGRWDLMTRYSLFTVPNSPARGTSGQDLLDLQVPAYQLDLHKVIRRYAKRRRVLTLCESLAAVHLDEAGTDAMALRNNGSAHFLYAPQPSLPVSRLRSAFTYVEPLVESPDLECTEEFWSLLEATSLGALVAATQYPPVRPAQLKTIAQSPEILAFAAAPAHFGAFGAAAPVGGMPVARGLQPVAPSLLPAGPSAPDRVPTELALIAHTHNGQSVHRIPGRTATRSSRLLTRQSISLPIPEPGFASGRHAALWNSEWASPAIRQNALAVRRRRRAGLGSASCTAVPLPDAPGSQPITLLSPAEAPQVREWCPASRFEPAGQQIAIAGQVRHELRPDLIDVARRAIAPQSLQRVLRVRLPRHSGRRIAGYDAVGCIPVAPPRARSIPSRPLIAEPVDLCPATVLGTARTGSAPCSLRQISLRLFRVPNALPTAKQSAAQAMVIGFDVWGAPPAICASNVIPDDGRPRVRNSSPVRFASDLRERFSKLQIKDVWNKASHLPSDLTWIAMVVPMVIGIWVLARPSTAEPVTAKIPAQQQVQPGAAPLEEKEVQLAALKPVSAPPVEDEKASAAIEQKPVKIVRAGGPTAWDNITAGIARRASVDLVEDFHNGLSSWDGKGEWARSWSYDRAGTVRPGHLAIFQPTIALRDYVFEMKASIDRRAIQWMVRASGPQNYHFFRLNVTPGAPLTSLELERWTVMNGHAGRVTRLPLPHGAANQTIYSIRAEVRGDSITTYLQDQVIDTFNDSRLPDGGIGLLGTFDDRPRIYGIHVFHQNDFWGKLCSFLTPPPIANQGSD